MNRRDMITLFAGAAVVPLFAGTAARAHHGWGWATDEEFELIAAWLASRW